MTLAYTFWHRPRPEIDHGEYESGLQRFHERLAVVPIPGFVDSWTLRVPDLPWLAGGGYEDWYLVEDFAALGELAEHAVDAARSDSHDVLARAVQDGAGGVYALLTGAVDAREGWCGWFGKRDGVGYPALQAALETQVENEGSLVVWQRQLVLGPAPEFRVLAPGPVTVWGADLAVGARVRVPDFQFPDTSPRSSHVPGAASSSAAAGPAEPGR
jgi:hypothetical protein